MQLLGLSLALFVALHAPARAAGPALSDQERAWIAAHPNVSVGVVADNEPYSFFRNGQMMGWTLDVLHRLEAVIGLSFSIRMGTWPEIYGNFRAGGLDVIADISRTEERLPFINYTDPYHLRRTVLFHNVDRPLESLDLDTLRNKRIGVIKDIYYGGALREAGLVTVAYDTYRDLMAALAFGWVDAALAAEMTGNFFARENGFSNVALAGTLPLTEVTLEDFRLGVLKADGNSDRAMLFSILEKAVATLPTEELAAITERWLSYRSGRSFSAGPLRLLPEEQDFVESAPPLKIGFISDYEPFSFLADGRGQGYAVDLAHEISARTGLVLMPVYDNWSNLLEAFHAGDIDIISNISYTDARAEYTLYSQEYHRIPNAVFVRSGFGPYRGLSSLAGKSVGIGRDIYYSDVLQARLDDVKTYATQEDILKALADGEVDAAVLALSNGNAIIRHLGLINIEIGGEFLMDGVEREDLRFGVSPRYPFVRSIIDRAMSAIPLSRWNELDTRWLGPTFSGAARQRVSLTTEEQDFLDSKGVLNVCVSPVTPPYTEVSDDGEFTGVAAEVMTILAERGGIDWQVVPVPVWGPTLAPPPDYECDVVPFAMERTTPNEHWTFTAPYLDLPMAVANRLYEPFVEGVGELADLRVGIVPERSPHDVLIRRYPEVRFVDVESEKVGLGLLRGGELDAMLGTLASLGQLIATSGANDVKVAGRIAEDWRASIATRADEPLLGAVFSRLVATLKDNEAQAILNREMLVRVERTVDYRLLLQLAAVAVLLLGTFFYWNRKLHRLNVALNTANEKLQEISNTDALTGLFNRRHFDDRAAAEFRICQRNGWLFAVAMIDVDRFKPINDKMGHLFGDLCLRHIADIAREYAKRSGDVVARYGGEEFVIYTLGGSGDDFVMRLERLRRELSERPVGTGAGRYTLTISIGCYAAVPLPGQTVSDFVRHADTRLYDAKKGGRNRVVATVERSAPAGLAGDGSPAPA
ncbi:diguanylate cyclase [Acuticoccus mangrovi]|uniref:diguanylate cyclase n=1 Tax=Acuticoccus mangrovi TaxID=2796142 RepID=A0A934MKI5_9HYPH|nr:transporter substrate-binding domain-containing protein [Acuticoccus mangrovi]